MLVVPTAITGHRTATCRTLSGSVCGVGVGISFVSHVIPGEPTG